MKENISNLKFDDKNFNKGTEYGKSLMNKSFKKFGAGRSILIDKNNKIIAGNKSAETFSEIGLKDIEIVESDGTKLIAVKRTDIDLDTPEGRELALVDNQTAKVNIDFDFCEIESELESAIIEEWGLLIDSEDIDLDNFFEVNESDKGSNNKIILEYTKDEYLEVIELFKDHKESKEQVVINLLRK